jgi:hypothetical protein
MRAAGAREVVQEQRYAHLGGGARLSATPDTSVYVWGSHFQVTLNGTRISSFEAAINSLQQTGPI